MDEIEAAKLWEDAVAQVLQDASEVAARAGCGPSQALLAMLVVEISGLRGGLEDGILLRLMTLKPPSAEDDGPEEGKEPWE